MIMTILLFDLVLLLLRALSQALTTSQPYKYFFF